MPVYGKHALEEEEDAYISLLERKLGIKKGKKGKRKYGSGFEGDGLLGERSALLRFVKDDLIYFSRPTK